jgi:hypothetical protein
VPRVWSAVCLCLCLLKGFVVIKVELRPGQANDVEEGVTGGSEGRGRKAKFE